MKQNLDHFFSFLFTPLDENLIWSATKHRCQEFIDICVFFEYFETLSNYYLSAVYYTNRFICYSLYAIRHSFKIAHPLTHNCTPHIVHICVLHFCYLFAIIFLSFCYFLISVMPFVVVITKLQTATRMHFYYCIFSMLFLRREDFRLFEKCILQFQLRYLKHMYNGQHIHHKQSRQIQYGMNKLKDNTNPLKPLQL